MKKGIKNTIIGQRIKALRTSNNMTIEEVGKIIHASKSNVSKYESAKIAVPYDKIESLAALFMVHPAYLMGWDVELNKGLCDDSNNPAADKFILNNLSRREISLIEKYRMLNSHGKERLDMQIDDMLELEKYTSQEKSVVSYA